MGTLKVIGNVIGDIGVFGKLLDPVKLTMNNGSVLTFLNGAGAIENSFGTTTSFTCCPLTLLNGLVSVDESKKDRGLWRILTGSLSSNTITVGRKTTLNYLPGKKNRNLEVLRGEKDFTYKYHEVEEKSNELNKICKFLVGLLGIGVFAADLYIRLKKIEFSKNGTVWNPKAGGKDSLVWCLKGFEAIENRLVGMLIFCEELAGAAGTVKSQVPVAQKSVINGNNLLDSLLQNQEALMAAPGATGEVASGNNSKDIGNAASQTQKEVTDTSTIVQESLLIVDGNQS